MENKKRSFITNIERVLNSKELTEQQRKALLAFDRFNEFESGCSLNTRSIYLKNLCDLGVKIGKPLEEMTKEDLQCHFSEESKHHADTTINLRKAHAKRFFVWAEWVRLNKDRSETEKLDLRNVNTPYNVAWIKLEYIENKLEYSDLPTEEEVY